MPSALTIAKTSKKSSARLGVLRTAHGRIQTPFFMTIATRGAVKTLTADEVKTLGAQIILSNTYHLWQRPGLPVIKKSGGLHGFMNWSGPILTDSGGYQVFSLAQKRKITEKGVAFVSEIDGTKYFLTPEKAVEIQHVLGSDIMMAFDECAPYPCSHDYAEKSLALTTRWAERCKVQNKKANGSGLLFGIVQGSVYRDLRLKSAKELVALDFDGYAVGGLAVGEPVEEMYEVLDYTVPALPSKKPRYLMGVGKPEQIVEAVKRGIDMFDCVIPTRNARHGLLYKYRRNNKKVKIVGRQDKFYEEIHIKKSQYARDIKPIDEHCDCYTCTHFSRAYLRHLFASNDPLALRLATLHNVRFYLHLMEMIRLEISRGKL
jgi:queuine tRNA-ribosyltransferase